MSSRLTVIFYIILCLEIGIVLTFLPWVPHGFLGLSDWGNNYFLGSNDSWPLGGRAAQYRGSGF